jgi:hypothetical protein
LLTTGNQKPQPNDFNFLEGIQRRLGRKLKLKDLEPKLADLLKVIELKYKLKDASEREQIFWRMVEEMVQEELGRNVLSGEKRTDV